MNVVGPRFRFAQALMVFSLFASVSLIGIEVVGYCFMDRVIQHAAGPSPEVIEQLRAQGFPTDSASLERLHQKDFVGGMVIHASSGVVFIPLIPLVLFILGCLVDRNVLGNRLGRAAIATMVIAFVIQAATVIYLLHAGVDLNFD